MDNAVVCGFWTNWSSYLFTRAPVRAGPPLTAVADHGPAAGWTLTVEQRVGDVIVAAVALALSFAGSQAWGIARFVAFRLMAAPQGNAEHHQVLALLVNTRSQLQLFGGMADILRGRRAVEPSERRARRSSDLLARMAPLLLLGAVSMAGVYVASLFGSQLVKAGDAARILSDRCGWVAEIEQLNGTGANQDVRDTSAVLLIAGRSAMEQSRTYARRCYARSDAEAADRACSSLARTRIESALSFEPCPFPAAVCKTKAARIDSGRIDSREVLGVNTQDESRVDIRKVMTCAPIQADQWATPWTPVGTEGRPGLPGDAIRGYAVGTMPGGDFPIATTNYSISLSSDPYPLLLVTPSSDPPPQSMTNGD